MAKETTQPDADVHDVEIGHVLDGFHAATAASNLDTYMHHFAPNGCFLGTDATEAWTVLEFRTYAQPHFDAGHGWVCHPVSATRKNQFSGSTTACIDKQLESSRWGMLGEWAS